MILSLIWLVVHAQMLH